MSKSVQFLLTRKRELEAEIEPIQKEIAEIDVMLSAVDHGAPAAKVDAKGASANTNSDSPKMTINAAIIEAVKNECRKPADIYKFMKDKLGVVTTTTSLSTRLTKLKANDLVGRNEYGWFIPAKENPEGEVSGEDAPSGLFSTQHDREPGRGGGT